MVHSRVPDPHRGKEKPTELSNASAPCLGRIKTCTLIGAGECSTSTPKIRVNEKSKASDRMRLSKLNRRLRTVEKGDNLKVIG